MSTTSRIYPVLSALYSLYDGLNTELTVHRGKPVSDPDGDFLAVGWAPGVVSAVNGTQDYEGATPAALRAENFTVTCYLETMTGDTDDASVLAREQRLFAYLDQIQVLHRTNKTLSIGSTSAVGGSSGSSGYVQFHSFDFVPDEAAQGFVAGLVFYIEAQAWI